MGYCHFGWQIKENDVEFAFNASSLLTLQTRNLFFHFPAILFRILMGSGLCHF